MKRLAAGLLLLSVVVFLPGSAAASPAPLNFKQMMNVIHGSGGIVIPSDWDGIWDYTDSTYDCTGAYQSDDSGQDTLCSGAGVFQGNFQCTGSATSTTIDVTCTDTEQFLPGCSVTYTYSIRGTRSGNTSFIVGNFLVTYDGVTPCDLIPDDCSQTNSHNTRVGPAPPTYCQTPTLKSTWGTLKIRYR